jgi:hypothetical protein
MRDTHERPKIAAEVRAWAVVTVAFVVQGGGAIWWAATLNAQLQALREVVTELKVQIASGYTAADAARDLSHIRTQLVDHETRLRGVERARP